MTPTTSIPPHRRKGRPRTFDQDAALASALRVFWRRGFEPASILELCGAMGINPPSLYAAFGNKAQLFMEAVNHYESTYWDAIWERMAETADVHEAVRTFFFEAAQVLSSQDTPCGCLVILAATNVSAEAEEVNAALKALRDEGKDQLTDRVRRGISDGQLPEATNAEGVGLTLNTLLEGMSLAARDGASRDELETIAASASGLLPQTAWLSTNCTATETEAEISSLPEQGGMADQSRSGPSVSRSLRKMVALPQRSVLEDVGR